VTTGSMSTLLLPAPAYVLARAAWIPTLVIWHANGRFTRLEGDTCDAYAAALAELAAASEVAKVIGFLLQAIGAPLPLRVDKTRFGDERPPDGPCEA
jgi:hypothetical protein